jgi:hypothetical protein
MAKITKVNLAKLFGSVATELAKNQSTLNQADKQNKDHGTNMVNVFNTITSAMEDKPKADPSAQLEYAAEQVRQNCQTGSGTVYADGLARAADALQGQNITSENAMQLITALMGSAGGSQAPASTTAASDPMASLLGSLISAQGGQTGQATSGDSSAEALSSLLGGLLGGTQPAQAAKPSNASTAGIGLEQVLAAGLEFVQSQNQGQDAMSSLLDAVLAGSKAGSGYREESGKLVAGTLMQGLGALLTKK